MTDARIAQLLAQATAIEQEARANWQQETDAIEKEDALIWLRQAVSLRKTAVSWIGRRAMRTARMTA